MSDPRREELQKRNFLEELFRIRDDQRQKRKLALIKGKALPWEKNRQGHMRWYMHPCIEDTAHQSLIVYEQNIPPQSRSGRQKHQGSMVIFILEGKGHTIMDGVNHPWQKGDCVQLPVRENGVIFQHFNDDPEQEARLLHVQGNLTQALGVDRGSGFEQLEVAPEHYNP